MSVVSTRVRKCGLAISRTIDAGVDDIKVQRAGDCAAGDAAFRAADVSVRSTHVAPFRSFRNFATAHAPRSHGTLS